MAAPRPPSNDELYFALLGYEREYRDYQQGPSMITEQEAEALFDSGKLIHAQAAWATHQRERATYCRC